MICEDLRGGESCAFVEALFSGLSPSGGLLMPRHLPVLRNDEIEGLLRLGFIERSIELTRLLIADELGEAACERIVREAFDFPIPLRSIHGRLPIIHALELFHGPTFAFKDFGARFMARAMAEARPLRREGASEPITILTATSGDTGAAVAQAFFGVASIQVVVLYPAGRISPVQEIQMVTLGGNVHALAVEGSFDDCQRLVKTAFEDDDLRRRSGLTTANSMNLGRLLPQTFYYFEAVAALAREEPGRPILVSVPSGNFGNLAAGVAAWKMGLPVAGFIAATNANDSVPRYLETGDYTPRPTIRTHSTAMDVGAPNNWTRVEHLLGGDTETLRQLVQGISIRDDETLETIRTVHSRSGYVLDPHSAVGFAALERVLAEGHSGVVLATAHPAKFNEVLRLALGQELPLPERLRDAFELPRREARLEASPGALREFLLALPGRV